MRRFGWTVVGLMVSAAAAEVTITANDDGYAIVAPAYRATVGQDGCFTGLRLGEAEYLVSAPQFPRGAYLYLKGLLRCPEVALEGRTITGTCEQGVVRYTFEDDAVTWSVTNQAKEPLLLVAVLSPELRAVRPGSGKWLKAPTARETDRSTWVLQGARLEFAGGTRIWGPWGAAGHPIWELRVAPGETGQARLSAGRATPAEEAAAAAAANAPPPQDPVGPMWDMTKLSQPPRTYPAPGFEEPGVEALFYDGVPFEGQPTRVFAWLGLPERKAGEQVPGIVLVHGGGGTAFANWVKLWTARGYAAIAMDTCGCVPRKSNATWSRHEHGGPPGWGSWGQLDWPREDHWTYHAVAAAILGHSLLRSRPEVDPDRIGLTGISWGGYLTCILAGVDDRFRFAAPVYGCGYYPDTNFAASVTAQGAEGGARWLRWWDPSVYLPRAKLPMLWVTGTNDFAFWFPGLQKSYRATPGPRTLAVRVRMPHGHGAAGEAPREIQVFADSLLRGGPALAAVTGTGLDDGQVWATFTSPVPVVRAELNYTLDDTPRWPDRRWETVPAQLTGQRAEAVLPNGAKVWYLNLVDHRDCVVSTEHVTAP